jgi:hypothetical protein
MGEAEPGGVRMRSVERHFEHHFPFPRPLIVDLLLAPPTYKTSSPSIKGGKEWTYVWEKTVSTEDPPPRRKGVGTIAAPRSVGIPRKPLTHSTLGWRATLRRKGRICALVDITDGLTEKDGSTVYTSEFLAAPIRGMKFRFWLEGSDRAEFDWLKERNERAAAAAAALWKRLE